MSGASRTLLGRAFPSENDRRSSSCSSSSSSLPSLTDFPCRRGGEGERKGILTRCQGKKRAVAISPQATMVSSKEQQKVQNPTSIVIDDALLSILRHLCTSLAKAAEVTKTAHRFFVPSHSEKALRILQAEILIEKGVVGCRSFRLIAVAGSLIGSILCFVEGCFLVLNSFFQYFHRMSQKADQGEIIQLLIEAIDMFLVGTALLTFGMALYAMFAASNLNKMGQRTPGSFGQFNLKRLSDIMGMHTISQAKSKIGHAVLLILQTGLMEKAKNVPLATSLDLACFAATILVSSASVFLLSKLTVQQNEEHKYI